MVKRISIDTDSYTDLDSYDDMFVQAVKFEVQANGSIMIKVGYRVVGVKRDGRQVELCVDKDSGSKDKCINWVTKNWLK